MTDKRLLKKHFYKSFVKIQNISNGLAVNAIFSSPELAQGELLGYRDVRRPSYVWTSVTSETYETSETSVCQHFSLCTL